MRWFISGVDSEGRSGLISSGTQHLSTEPGSTIERIFATSEIPPSPRPEGHGLTRDLGVGPGLLEWRILSWGPGRDLAVHHTDTIDMDCILEGTVDLILDDGVHTLVPGDCVVIPGVDHGWRTNDTGCVIALGLLGSPPRTRISEGRTHSA